MLWAKISTFNGETGLQTIFTQFHKVPDCGSLVRVPLFSSSFLKKEREGEKKKANSFQTHIPTTTRAHTTPEMETLKRGKTILGLEINLILFYVGKVFSFSSILFNQLLFLT